MEEYCQALIEVDVNGHKTTMTCGQLATHIEYNSNHWQDWLWCPLHVKERANANIEVLNAHGTSV